SDNAVLLPLIVRGRELPHPPQTGPVFWPPFHSPLVRCAMRRNTGGASSRPTIAQAARMRKFARGRTVSPSSSAAGESTGPRPHPPVQGLVADSWMDPTIGVQVLRDAVLEVVDRDGLGVFQRIARRHQEVRLADRQQLVGAACWFPEVVCLPRI